MKKTTEYSTLPHSQTQTNSRAHRQQKVEVITRRYHNNKRDINSRKHNSPDYNRYRQNNKNRGKYEIQCNRYENRLNRSNDKSGREFRLTYKQSKEDGDRYQRGRQMIKDASSPSLAQYQQVQHQETQEYHKLHQKLNFIENKIADMKRHVQKKKEEKQKLIQAKKQKARKREQERASNQQAQTNSQQTDLKQFVSSQKQHKELHTFQKNPYSPHHNVYYISQVVKSFGDEKSLAREHLLTSLHILKILQNTRFATDEQMRQRQVKLARRKGCQGKKSIIFDLDETLIHCNDTLTPPYDIKLPITFPTGQVIEAGINIRPHAQQILQNLSKHFEIIVFTASHSCYANVVLDYLDPNNECIHHRLFRQHCYQTPQGMYCKDLRVINRQLSEMVLVDNAAYSYSAQLQNGIPILPYYHGKADFQLKALEKYLLRMVMLEDVRVLNEQTFCLHLYRHYYDEPQRLIQQLYLSERSR